MSTTTEIVAAMRQVTTVLTTAGLVEHTPDQPGFWVYGAGATPGTVHVTWSDAGYGDQPPPAGWWGQVQAALQAAGYTDVTPDRITNGSPVLVVRYAAGQGGLR